MAKLTFLGAAGTVTGSKYLVEAKGTEGHGRLLIDGGLFQGSKQLRLRNWERLPIAPATIDWALLTHAHIDHTGYLPRLVRDGFRGPIFANAATRDLCTFLLPDSARLQEEDAEYATRKGFSKHTPALPLYTEEEANRALERFQIVPRAESFRISPNFAARYLDAGHILGSAMIELTVTENGKSQVILFSGDVGRYDQPILNDPAPPPRCDVLLCESTYGNREHPAGSPHDALAEVVTRVAKRGGVIVLPAFAVGRTQTLLYVLRQLEEWQRIPVLPIFVDSPMAIGVTTLYRNHREDHDAEYRAEARGGDPLLPQNCKMTQSVEDSKRINAMAQPCVIISASGMATGGRVLHHLARRLPDARNAVVLAGFQSEGTRGRSLLEGARTLRIHGEDVVVKAEVIRLDQFSGHAGKSELLRWLTSMPAPPRQTFLVHGEPESAVALQQAIRAGLRWDVSIAAHLQSVEFLAS